MTMLMLLALMTYGRLETYRSSQIFQVLFENYMEEDERGYINMIALKKYNDAKGSKKESGATRPKVLASPRISISLLLKKEDKEKAPLEVASFYALFKNLMISLYDEQPFYKKILEERPHFLKKSLQR